MKIATVLLNINDQVLLLKKPQNAYFSIPGGKCEDGEQIDEAAKREFYEETNLVITPELKAVSKIKTVEKEYTMYTYLANNYIGNQVHDNHEGQLIWKNINELHEQTFLPGDYEIIKQLLHENGVREFYFEYDQEYNLLVSE